MEQRKKNQNSQTVALTECPIDGTMLYSPIASKSDFSRKKNSGNAYKLLGSPRKESA